MLLFEDPVRRAASNLVLGEASRYAAQRWAELLDEHTHYSQSASSIIPEPVALDEFAEEGRVYLADKRAHFANMLECFKRTASNLRLDPNVGTWFPAERAAALKAFDGVDPIPRGRDPEQWVDQHTNAVLAAEVPALLAVLNDAVDGYRPRLLNVVLDVLSAPPTNARGWRAFDENLSYLAAVALSEGRGGRHLALNLAVAFGQAASDNEAAAALRTLLGSTSERFVVAACVAGTNKIKKIETFGCKPLSDPPTWPNGNRGHAGTRLRQYYASRLAPRTCGILVEVDALDPEHARGLALERIELLHDHIAAEHRIARFSVSPEVLVLREARNRVTRLGGDVRTVEEARPLGGRRLRVLQRSLRFYKLARSEETAVISVVQSWIALENLAHGAQAFLQKQGTRKWVATNPATFLPRHVGAVIYLASSRNQIISSWHLARRECGLGPARSRFQELSRWLGVLAARKWFVDPDRWLAVLEARPAAVAPDPLPLTATPAQAAAVLRDLLQNATPYIRVRVEDSASMVKNPARLSEWGSRVERRAEASVSRIRMLRNRIVHGAMPGHESAEQVAAAGRHLLDAVYEVVPAWLRPGMPVWRALYDARGWQQSLRKRWRAPRAVFGVTVDSIVRGP